MYYATWFIYNEIPCDDQDQDHHPCKDLSHIDEYKTIECCVASQLIASSPPSSIFSRAIYSARSPPFRARTYLLFSSEPCAPGKKKKDSDALFC